MIVLFRQKSLKLTAKLLCKMLKAILYTLVDTKVGLKTEACQNQYSKRMRQVAIIPSAKFCP